MSSHVKFMFSILILSFFTLNTFAQNDNIRTDTTYLSDGTIKSYGYYKSDKKIGTWHHFFPNKISEQKITYLNGERILLRNYDRGKLFEICVSVQKEKVEETQCQDFYNEGCLKMYYKSVKEKDKESGKIEGPFYEFYPDGAVQNIKHYLNDKVNGKWIDFYENGIVRSEGNNFNWNNTGQWKYYYENGQLESEGEYVVIVIDENNVHKYKKYINTMVNGAISIKNGKWNYYNNSGKLMKQEIYKEGELVSTKEIE